MSPPFENPDEMNHAEFAAFLGARGRLPVLERDCIRLAFHPPLYHALLAPIARAMHLGPDDVMSGNRVNPDFASTGVMLVHGYPDEAFPYSGVSRFVFIGRLLSILCGVVLLIFTARLVALITDDQTTQLVAVAVVAAIPQLQYMAASLNHDLLAAACATAALFYSVRLLHDLSSGTAAKSGLALGLGLLTKSSVVPLMVVPALSALNGRAGHGVRLRNAAVAYGVTLLVAGWWYVRNLLLYGNPVPTIYLHETTWIGTGLVNHGTVDVSYLWAASRQLFQSFWFLAGGMNVAAATWMYGVWLATSILAIVGMLRLFGRPEGRVLVGSWLAVVLAVFQYLMHVYSSQGRYLFIVVATVGIAVATVVAVLPPSRRRVAGQFVVALLTCVAVTCFVLSFRPTYTLAGSPQRSVDRDLPRLYCRTEYTQPIRVTGGRLHGLTVRARRLGKGDYDLQMALKTKSGETVRTASLSGTGLSENSDDVTLSFDPITTNSGELYYVSLRAPKATPISRPWLRYSTAQGPEEDFTVNGSPGHGHIPIRGEYE